MRILSVIALSLAFLCGVTGWTVASGMPSALAQDKAGAESGNTGSGAENTGKSTESDSPTLFFSTMTDIPAMEGLVELDDYALVYDKPEGRIAEMAARIEGGDVEAVRDYYKNTLPELGWRFETEDAYTRGSEMLTFFYEQRQGLQYVLITVQPLQM